MRSGGATLPKPRGCVPWDLCGGQRFSPLPVPTGHSRWAWGSVSSRLAPRRWGDSPGPWPPAPGPRSLPSRPALAYNHRIDKGFPLPEGPTMPAPATVKELIDRFGSHVESYRSGQYNEAQVRGEFLDPFFEALGWDVYNRKGYAEAYKEVIHEDAIKIGGRTKAPDYCFRVGGGQRSFFVEAKRPSVDIREAISPAYQLRRYAWSAKLPVSILTRLRGAGRLRLPHPAGKERQGVHRPHPLLPLQRLPGALGRALRTVLAGGDPPRLAGKTGGLEEDQEGDRRGRCRLPPRDRIVARRAGAEPGHCAIRASSRRT